MSKGSHSKNMFMRIMCSPIRALGKARDAYVRGITNCGQSMSYGSYPMDDASRFSSLSRSQSAATTSSRRSSSASSLSRLDDNEDFAELVRAASARTLGNRIDVDLVMKQRQQQEQQKMNKKLPKSSSVGMAKIDEDMPMFDSGVGNGVGFVGESYPRSKSYAVGNRSRNGVF